MKNLTPSFGLIGLLCIFFAATALILTGSKSYFFWTELAVGLILLAIYLATHFTTFLGLFSKRGLARQGSHTFIYSLIIFFIIAMVNSLSFNKINTKFDLTEEKVFTLSDQSQKICKNLTEKIEIIAFFKDLNPLSESVDQLLQMYQDQSSKISYRFVDPDRQPEIAKNAGAKDGQVYFKSGLETHLVDQPSEENFTNALIKIAQTEKPIVYALTSHGCRKASDEAEEGLSSLKKALQNEGFIYRPLENLNQAIPEDADILLIAGPQEPFSAIQRQKIESFLDSGGNAFLMIDPILSNPRFSKQFTVLESGLEQFFEDHGILVGKDLILESHLQPIFGLTTGFDILASPSLNSPITKNLKGQQIYFREANSLSRIYNNSFQGVIAELAKSAGKGASWAEKKINLLLKDKKAAIDKEDLKGPIAVAFSLARQEIREQKEKAEGKQQSLQSKVIKPEYRIILTSDSDFASNNILVRYAANQDFVLNAFNWLAKKEANISIRPKSIKSSHLLLDTAKRNIIFYCAVLGIPQLIMVIGLFVWYWRRRK